MANENILAWVDLETFDLPPTAPIIEVGIILTDPDLNEITHESWLCWESHYEEAWKNAPQIVRDMHNNSGLIDRAREFGKPRREVQRLAVKWLRYKDATGLPICGNSVAADKAWLGVQMPELLASFHYRVIDVSSFKEACRRWNPEVFAQAPVKKEAHTAIEDLRESIAEMAFYKDNFLFESDTRF